MGTRVYQKERKYGCVQIASEEKDKKIFCRTLVSLRLSPAEISGDPCELSRKYVCLRSSLPPNQKTFMSYSSASAASPPSGLEAFGERPGGHLARLFKFLLKKTRGHHCAHDGIVHHAADVAERTIFPNERQFLLRFTTWWAACFSSLGDSDEYFCPQLHSGFDALWCLVYVFSSPLTVSPRPDFMPFHTV